MRKTILVRDQTSLRAVITVPAYFGVALRYEQYRQPVHRGIDCLELRYRTGGGCLRLAVRKREMASLCLDLGEWTLMLLLEEWRTVVRDLLWMARLARWS